MQFLVQKFPALQLPNHPEGAFWLSPKMQRRRKGTKNRRGTKNCRFEIFLVNSVSALAPPEKLKLRSSGGGRAVGRAVGRRNVI